LGVFLRETQIYNLFLQIFDTNILKIYGMSRPSFSSSKKKICKNKKHLSTMSAKESAPISLVNNLNRYTNIITKNIEYTIDPQSNIEETTLYYYQTLEVGQHHTMDPIMEGILSCSLASSRGHPPIELQLIIQ
jgi:hypothetical protein